MEAREGEPAVQAVPGFEPGTSLDMHAVLVHNPSHKNVLTDIYKLLSIRVVNSQTNANRFSVLWK